MSKKRFEWLAYAQWELIESLLPEPKRHKDKRDRPWASSRDCLEGILWVLQNGRAAFSAKPVYFSSDLLPEPLKKRGIDLIVPYRKNRKHRRYEDGSKLTRYKRRWLIERTNAWLGQFRRLPVRHEHLLATIEPSSISPASRSPFADVNETCSSQPYALT
ncbi:transposase [Granulicella aggregans]|uniref:transposase n=1 Tax=Granulicella aggregans TaxID=474949 RepID=UPI0037BE2EF4